MKKFAPSETAPSSMSSRAAASLEFSQHAAPVAQAYALPSAFGLESLHSQSLSREMQELAPKRRMKSLFLLAAAGGVFAAGIYWKSSSSDVASAPVMSRQIPLETAKPANDALEARTALSQPTSAAEVKTANSAQGSSVKRGPAIGYFAYNKAALSPKTRTLLDKWAERMNQDQQLSLVIEGHCDEKGSAAYNYKLGQKRAAAAKAYLVKKGIDENRLTGVSYGKTRPISHSKDPKTRAQNRRIELRATELVPKL